MNKLAKSVLSNQQERELKKEWLRKEHFIYYPQAKKCIDFLLANIDSISPYQPGKENIPYDQKATSIIGMSGCGKTMVFKEFVRRINNSYIDNRWKRYRIAYTICDDSITGLKGLYATLFKPLGHPYGEKEISKRYRVAQLHETLVPVLYNSNFRAYGIDEFQHLQGASSTRQSIINQMKKIMLEASIPFIPIGTPKTIEVLKTDTDEQLYNRCRPTKVTTFTYWRNNKSLREFIKAYERFLPFKYPSGLVDHTDEIFDAIKVEEEFNGHKNRICNLRNLVDFIKHCALNAINKFEDSISKSTIDYNMELFSPIYDLDELLGF